MQNIGPTSIQLIPLSTRKDGRLDEKTISIPASKIDTLVGRLTDEPQSQQAPGITSPSDEDIAVASAIGDVYVSGLTHKRSLRSKTVSRSHARILWKEIDTYLCPHVRDNGSTHGTYRLPNHYLFGVHDRADYIREALKTMKALVPISSHSQMPLSNGDYLIFGKRIQKEGIDAHSPAVFQVKYVYARSERPVTISQSQAARSVRPLPQRCSTATPAAQKAAECIDVDAHDKSASARDERASLESRRIVDALSETVSNCLGKEQSKTTSVRVAPRSSVQPAGQNKANTSTRISVPINTDELDRLIEDDLNRSWDDVPRKSNATEATTSPEAGVSENASSPDADTMSIHSTKALIDLAESSVDSAVAEAPSSSRSTRLAAGKVNEDVEAVPSTTAVDSPSSSGSPSKQDEPANAASSDELVEKGKEKSTSYKTWCKHVGGLYGATSGSSSALGRRVQEFLSCKEILHFGKPQDERAASLSAQVADQQAADDHDAGLSYRPGPPDASSLASSSGSVQSSPTIGKKRGAEEMDCDATITASATKAKKDDHDQPIPSKRSRTSAFGVGLATGIVAGVVTTFATLSSMALNESDLMW